MCALLFQIPLAAACSDQDMSVRVDKGPVEASCPEQRLRADGACCPGGSFYDFESSTCLTVGPPECAGAILTSPDGCTPRWCWDWREASGDACTGGEPGCLPAGRRCTADELAAGVGCLAGYWPAPGGKGECIAAGPPSQAGWSTDGSGARVVPPPLTEPVRPPGVPPMELPAVDDTRFCLSSGGGHPGQIRLCDTVEAGCGPGRMPNPDDTSACIPVGVPWSCPPGFVVDADVPVELGAPAACAPDPSDCGAGPYAKELGGGQILYVDAQAQSGGSGSKQAPFKSVSEALALANSKYANATLAVAKGTYKEALKVNVPLRIVGRCAAMVKVTAPTNSTAVEVAGQPTTSEAVISGLEISGGKLGVSTFTPLPLRLERVWIHKAGGVGLYANGAARVQIRASVISNTKQQKPLLGLGVLIRDGAHVTAMDLRVSRNRSAGIYLLQAGSLLQADRLLVDSTLPGFDTGLEGGGIFANSGARLLLTSTRLQHNRSAGLDIKGATSSALATGFIIDDTLPEAATQAQGFGALIYKQARLVVRGARIHGCRRHGLNIQDQDSTLFAYGLIVDDTDAQALNGLEGYGVTVRTGAKATIHSARISANRSLGLTASGMGTHMMVKGALVDDTLPEKASGKLGLGVFVTKGATANLAGIRLTDNHSGGLVLADSKTAGVVSDLLVEGTLPQVKPPTTGRAVDVDHGASLELMRARLVIGDGSGLRTGVHGATVSARQLVVQGSTGKGNPHQTGHGIEAGPGTNMQLEQVRLSACQTTGLYVKGPNVTVRGVGLTIDGTRPQAGTGLLGLGISIEQGAIVEMGGVGVLDSRTAGLYAGNSGTRVSLYGALIEGTSERAADGHLGFGVAAMTSADVSLMGSIVGRNTVAGLIACNNEGGGTGAQLVGTVVEHTRPTLAKDSVSGDSYETFGVGVLAIAGLQKLSIVSSVLRANHSAGIALDDAGGLVDGTVVTGTKPATYRRFNEDGAGISSGQPVQLSDGIIAWLPPKLVIRHSLLHKQARAGLLFNGGDDISVTRTVATGGVYGVVSQGGANIHMSGNLFFDNVTNIVTKGELEVPMPPLVLSVGLDPVP